MTQRPLKPLDSALAFAVLLPMVLAPAYFFARMESAREHASSEEWMGLAIARAASTGSLDIAGLPPHARPGLAYVFSMTEGGVDDFGIAKTSRISVVDSSGNRVDLPGDMTSRMREAAGVVRSLPAESDGACTARGLDLSICGVRSGPDVSGTVLHRTHLDFPVAAPLAVLVFGTFAVFILSRRTRGRRLGPVVTCVGAAAGAVGSWFLALTAGSVVDSSVDIEMALAQSIGRISGQLPVHDPATGIGFIVFVTLVAAVLLLFLHGSTARLLSNLRDRPLIYAAIAPAIIGMILLIFVPFFMGVYLAFMDNSHNFIGLANFADILFPSQTSDTNFYLTLGVTILWTTLNVTLHVVIGLVLALILSDARLRGRSWYRVLLIVPWAVPNYITALIWKWVFNTQYGPANAFLALVGLSPVDWLGRSFVTNFTANLVTNTWLGFPFMMVVALGALQSIPSDLYEAAEMDGAGRWQRFTNVTMPLLKPALFPAIILGTIWTFNMFNVVYLVSGGAPDNQTNILITEAYRAFRVLRNYGLAAAYSLIIFVILAVYTGLTNRMTRAAESVYE